jgi:hypothetical protein
MVVKEKAHQSGQALIELIIFLPLMFALYGMISGFANAINGSINQQKFTRSYFYFRIQNNSMIPKPDIEVAQNWTKFGMNFVGWTDYFVGDNPVMPCYRVSVPLAASDGDVCDKEYSDERSQFIRVGTAYGVCGTTFAKTPSGTSFFMMPDYDGADFRELIDVSSCTIQ